MAYSCCPERHARTFATFNPEEVERATDEVDVLIVGAGPAGLSAAIRLKQLSPDSRVVILEKGAEVGAHILSGAVIEPRALDELIPDWRTSEDWSECRDGMQEVAKSDMLWLTKPDGVWAKGPMRGEIPLPHPPQMSNKGNYIVSLSAFTRHLATIAESLEVEIYPGFAGSQLLFSNEAQPRVIGVRTNDIGLSNKYTPKDNFEPGMDFHARLTLLAEGAHGSLTKGLIPYYRLREKSGKQSQTYGMGIKGRYQPGKVVHTLGHPLNAQTYGGGWVYHMANGMVSLGLVVGCDWKNPYLSPYREFQGMLHILFLSTKAERLQYGGRVLTEGGITSLPDPLHFPGGAIIGCAGGFMNVPKIKGTHGAMKSGMLAAEAAAEALKGDKDASLENYTDSFKKSWLYDELFGVRNIRRSFNTSLGVYGGMAWSGLDTVFQARPIDYPAFEPPLSTDLMTSVALTGTNHEEESIVHLKSTRRNHVKVNTEEFAGLLGRACPAGVYEYVDADATGGDGTEYGGKKLVINSQNCIHCKLCDVKVPTQDITWCVPEGGGGPKYSLT
ncbi:hypothetical protein DL96DRAFT_1667924 [Flagelloscypha sp. PMI_526]|nr:hypothetical protein DL96DRAFT_1667924 [Flagelloscypha sp. PMI_526]